MNLKNIFSKYINGNKALNHATQEFDESKKNKADEINVIETSDKPTNRSKKYKAVK